MKLTRKDKLNWLGRFRLSAIRTVAFTMFRLYLFKEFLADMLHTMWINAPWFIQEENPPRRQIQSFSLGMRLVYKCTGDHKKPHQLFWTDGKNREHRLIVLAAPRGAAAHGRESVSSEERTELMTSDQADTSLDRLYDAPGKPYRAEGFNLTDMELNEWLSGWNIDDLPFNHRGGSSA